MFTFYEDLGFILITNGKTCGHRNDCHEERSVLYSQILEEARYVMQGHMGKHRGQSGGRESEGRTWTFTGFSMGRKG